MKKDNKPVSFGRGMNVTCSHCGHKFYVPDGQYVYKIYHGKTKWFCRWSCMCRYREAHPKQRGNKLLE